MAPRRSVMASNGERAIPVPKVVEAQPAREHPQPFWPLTGCLGSCSVLLVRHAAGRRRDRQGREPRNFFRWRVTSSRCSAGKDNAYTGPRTRRLAVEPARRRSVTLPASRIVAVAPRPAPARHRRVGRAGRSYRVPLSSVRGRSPRVWRAVAGRLIHRAGGCGSHEGRHECDHADDVVDHGLGGAAALHRHRLPGRAGRTKATRPARPHRRQALSRRKGMSAERDRIRGTIRGRRHERPIRQSWPPTSGRPDGLSDKTVEAPGALSKVLETTERARGRLYDFHRLAGAADLELDRAVELLHEAWHPPWALRVRTEILGRNVIPGHWTFQIVEAYDAFPVPRDRRGAGAGAGPRPPVRGRNEGDPSYDRTPRPHRHSGRMTAPGAS